ncbi:MAG: hypothetical protein IH984_10905 [Planctomycetes bacterium]|nr:hypothetical protein [Planctomycetota bacterium]
MTQDTLNNESELDLLAEEAATQTSEPNPAVNRLDDDDEIEANEERQALVDEIDGLLEEKEYDAEADSEEEEAIAQTDLEWQREQAAVHPMDGISENSARCPSEKATIQALADMLPSDAQRQEFDDESLKMLD